MASGRQLAASVPGAFTASKELASSAGTNAREHRGAAETAAQRHLAEVTTPPRVLAKASGRQLGASVPGALTAAEELASSAGANALELRGAAETAAQGPRAEAPTTPTFPAMASGRQVAAPAPSTLTAPVPETQRREEFILSIIADHTLQTMHGGNAPPMFSRVDERADIQTLHEALKCLRPHVPDNQDLIGWMFLLHLVNARTAVSTAVKIISDMATAAFTQGAATYLSTTLHQRFRYQETDVFVQEYCVYGLSRFDESVAHWDQTYYHVQSLAALRLTDWRPCRIAATFLVPEVEPMYIEYVIFGCCLGTWLQGGQQGRPVMLFEDVDLLCRSASWLRSDLKAMGIRSTSDLDTLVLDISEKVECLPGYDLYDLIAACSLRFHDSSMPRYHSDQGMPYTVRAAPMPAPTVEGDRTGSKRHALGSSPGSHEGPRSTPRKVRRGASQSTTQSEVSVLSTSASGESRENSARRMCAASDADLVAWAKGLRAHAQIEVSGNLAQCILCGASEGSKQYRLESKPCPGFKLSEQRSIRAMQLRIISVLRSSDPATAPGWALKKLRGFLAQLPDQ